ncbi:MAG: metallophosphoesterase [Peptostreptococcaceae bacterium]|nr:metallophosphoesterase [Peptostreptococcaceae bacterium]
MKKPYNKSKRLKSTFVSIPLIIAFCMWQNNSIVVSNSDYSSANVPVEFDGFKIVQISDLHNKMFGKDQIRLLEKMESLSPDIIVVTGDLIDRRRFDLETAMCFIEGAVKISPVYYVSGNHEAWFGKYSEITNQLIDAGVRVMDDDSIELKKGSDVIQIIGSPNPDLFSSSSLDGSKTDELDTQLKMLRRNDVFSILLAHHPEFFDIYHENRMDLIFAGHAHGGQFRIPFIGGLFAPDQGLFPGYTSGCYVKGTSTMFVSRGLGNSIIPIRINNPPEIVEVTLKSVEG